MAKNKLKTAPIDLEKALALVGKKCIIGIDEAGKGSLAGNFFVGFSAIPFYHYNEIEDTLEVLAGVKDSKQFSSHGKREDMFIRAKQHAVCGAITISAGDIDKYGIGMCNRWAVVMAIDAAINRLEVLHKDNPFGFIKPTIDNVAVLCDGGIWVGKHIEPYQFVDSHDKGDSKSISIALASIAAKVARDKHIEKLDELYPQYNFMKTRGYWSSQENADMITNNPQGMNYHWRRSFNPLKTAVGWHKPLTYGTQPPIEFHSNLLKALEIPDLT